MLTGVIATISTESPSVGVPSVTIPTGLPEYAIMVFIALNLLLLAQEIMSTSDRWNKTLKCSLNMTIFPLLFSFAAMVIFKISEII